MKTKNIVKIFLGVFITSFIFVLSFMFVGVAHAEEVATATATATTQTTEQAVEQTKTTIQTAIDFLKNLKAEDVKGWIVAIFVKFGLDTGILLTLAIALVRTKLSNVSNSKMYQELEAKLTAEHQKEMKELIKEFDNKLEEVNNNVTDSIKQLDEEKRKEAESDIAVLKDKLAQLKTDVEK